MNKVHFVSSKLIPIIKAVYVLSCCSKWEYNEKEKNNYLHIKVLLTFLGLYDIFFDQEENRSKIESRL
jgi:hypothetical protein